MGKVKVETFTDLDYINFAKFTWDTDVTFTGRNGTFSCKGLEIISSHGKVDFQPITRRGKAGNCRIEIPCDAIPSVIVHLKRILKNLAAHKGAPQ